MKLKLFSLLTSPNWSIQAGSEAVLKGDSLAEQKQSLCAVKKQPARGDLCAYEEPKSSEDAAWMATILCAQQISVIEINNFLSIIDAARQTGRARRAGDTTRDLHLTPWPLSTLTSSADKSRARSLAVAYPGGTLSCTSQPSRLEYMQGCQSGQIGQNMQSCKVANLQTMHLSFLKTYYR